MLNIYTQEKAISIHPAALVCFFAYTLIQGEAMVDAGRQGDQVPLAHGDADPSVLLVPHIKVGRAVQDVADLIVQVQMLLKEHLQLIDKNREHQIMMPFSSMSFRVTCHAGNICPDGDTSICDRRYK